MDKPTKTSYAPTMLTALGLVLTLCMPVIFMIAVLGERFIPFSMGSIIFALIVGVFVTPAGLLLLLILFVMKRKRPNKPIRWRSALLGSCVALGLSTIAWFWRFSFSM